MKKSLLVLLIIGILLTFGGGVVFVVGFASAGWDYKALSGTQLETVRFTESAENPITALALDFDNSDITVVFDETAESVVVEYSLLETRKGKNLSEVTLINEDGKLILIEKISSWKLGLWDFTNPKTTIILPAARSYALAIETDNGGVTLTGAGQTTSLSVNTDNGDLTLTNIVCENTITLNSDNGTILLENITAKTLTAESDDGDIRIKGNLLAEHIQMQSDNGDIKTKEGILDGKNLVFESDNGDIKVQLAGKQTDYAVLVKTDNGKSNLAPSLNASQDARNFKAETDNGNIFVTFAEE